MFLSFQEAAQVPEALSSPVRFSTERVSSMYLAVLCPRCLRTLISVRKSALFGNRIAIQKTQNTKRAVAMDVRNVTWQKSRHIASIVAG
ncbi:hypothetical protein K3495_g6702 [Podosphaera aphanis]|nr:hypothetical protein K3495_g6702 [Podosphaera aphanis]